MRLEYKYMNLNPKGKKAADCVIRAIAAATDEPWEKVYKEMSELGIKSGLMINEKRLEEKYLKIKKFIKFKQPIKEDRTKYTVREFIEKFSNEFQNKKIILTVNNHMTYVKANYNEAILFDTWDCREEYIRNYFISS